MGERNTELLDAAVAGDQDAFTKLFELHREPLSRLCTSVLGDADLAQDVVQNTWLRARRAIGEFDRSQALAPWLQTIARRLCYDELRARRRRLATETRSVARDPALEPDHAQFVIEMDPRGSRILKSFFRLPERYRRMIYLREVEGWSYQELAEHDGSSATSIAKVLMRAKERLRDGLGGPLSLAPLWLRVRRRLVSIRAALGNASIEDSPGWMHITAAGIALFAFGLPGGLAAPSTAHAQSASDRAGAVARSPWDRLAEQEGRASTSPMGIGRGRDVTRAATPAGSVELETGTNSGGVDPSGGWRRVTVYDGDEHPVARGTSWTVCPPNGVLPPEAPASVECS